MAPDHDARRRLARDAGAHGWSVRQTEARARAAAGREDDEIAAGRIQRTPHPDQVDAAERLGEAFGRALGADVRVTPRASGYRVQFAFETLDEALEAAERLGVTGDRLTGPARPARAAIIGAPHGRLAQSVRALL